MDERVRTYVLKIVDEINELSESAGILARCYAEISRYNAKILIGEICVWAALDDSTEKLEDLTASSCFKRLAERVNEYLFTISRCSNSLPIAVAGVIQL